MSTSLRKGLQVLDFLAEAQGPATVREISRGTGLPKSTVHRLASELHELGVIEVEPSGYRLGLRLFELGGVALRQTRLEEIVRSYMEELYGSREGVMAGPLDGVKVVEFSEGRSDDRAVTGRRRRGRDRTRRSARRSRAVGARPNTRAPASCSRP
jgi:DNA-binding transcriptional ArsR family regulator